MSGFFKIHEIAGSDPDKVYGCGPCDLYRTCIHPRMKPHGEGRKGIMIIAEAPGEKEDQRGVPLVGDCGLLVRKLLKRNGVDLDLDCVKTNAVACRPEDNRTPTIKEIACCRPRVWDTIQFVKPKVLFLFGESAVNSFLSHRMKKEVGNITRWVGRAIPDQETGIWVVPTYHPSFILRNPQNPVVEMDFERDLKFGIQLLNKPFPDYGKEESKIKVLTKKIDIIDLLVDIMDRKPEYLSIDYETSGIKPHAPGHFIECASLAESGDEGYAFPFYPDIKKYWVKILRDKQIGKMAHNMKFEDTWSYHILGTRTSNWVWDSMIAAHVLDNRGRVCGLKFQSYINFGLIDYDSHLSKYLEAGGGRKASANDFNRVRKANRIQLLTYCGMDSMLEHRLAMIQMEAIEEGWE